MPRPSALPCPDPHLPAPAAPRLGAAPRPRHWAAFAAASALVLAACGGGGDTSPAPSTPTASPAAVPSTAVSALVQKGPVQGASCVVLNAARQVVGSAATTGADGRVEFGSVAGVDALATTAVTVQCQGGRYVDESTGSTVDLVGIWQAPALPTADGRLRRAVVTPLSHLAWAQAGADPARLAEATARVAKAFGLAGVDVTTTAPTDITTVAAADDGAGRYGVVLAGLAQLAQDQGRTVEGVATALAAALNGGDALEASSAAALHDAIGKLTASRHAGVAAHVTPALLASLGAAISPARAAALATEKARAEAALAAAAAAAAAASPPSTDAPGGTATTAPTPASAAPGPTTTSTTPSPTAPTTPAAETLPTAPTTPASSSAVAGPTVPTTPTTPTTPVTPPTPPQPVLLDAQPLRPAVPVAGGAGGTWNLAGTALAPVTAVTFNGEVCAVAGVAAADGTSIAGVDCRNVRSAEGDAEAELAVVTPNGRGARRVVLQAPAVPTLSLALSATVERVGALVQATPMTNSGGTVTFASDRPDLATIDASGRIELRAPGVVTLRAMQAAVAGAFTTAQASATLTIAERRATTLVWARSGDQALMLGSGTLANPARAQCDGDATPAPTPTYSVEPADVATVDAAGTVTPSRAGLVRVTARVPAFGTCSAQSAGYHVVVGRAAPAVTFESTEPLRVVAGGASRSIAARVAGLPEPLPGAGLLALRYESLDPSIATVSATGVVTGRAIGSTTLVATVAGDANYLGSDEAPTVRAELRVDVVAGYSVGGSLGGLDAGGSVVLQNNAGDELTVTADNAAAFTFPTRLAGGSGYAVAVRVHAVGQQCTVYRASGTIVASNVADVTVFCQRQQVTTMAGSGVAGATDGWGAVASFRNPAGMVMDAHGSIYVADFQNHKIRKVSPAGYVSTLAGSGSVGYADGAAAAAQFNRPLGLAIAPDGTVYVSDTYNGRIRRLSPDGQVTTFAGSGTMGFADGVGTQAAFNRPAGVAIDAAGNLYVADTYNNRIRRITPGGVVTTVAGNGGAGAQDGPGATATFRNPTAVAVMPDGTLVVGDTLNHKVRLVSPAGIVSTLAGAGTAGATNGVGTAARFNMPYGVGVTAGGSVVVADLGNQLVRRISPGGVVETFAGAGVAGSTNGTTAEATFRSPYAVMIDHAGNVFVGDYGNHMVRRIAP